MDGQNIYLFANNSFLTSSAVLSATLRFLAYKNCYFSNQIFFHRQCMHLKKGRRHLKQITTPPPCWHTQTVIVSTSPTWMHLNNCKKSEHRQSTGVLYPDRLQLARAGFNPGPLIIPSITLCSFFNGGQLTYVSFILIVHFYVVDDHSKIIYKSLSIV